MARPRKRSGGLSDHAQRLDASVFLEPIDPILPKTAQVYEVIRRAIVGLRLEPGSVINESEICDQLGISRTPLREAILRLAAERLISVVPNSGTYVAPIDLTSVFDGQLVRDALEMKVVRLAATKMNPVFGRQLDFNLHQQARLAEALDYDGFYELDEQFHSMICEFGASRNIWTIVNGAKAQLDRVRRLAFPVPSHLNIVLQEHSEIANGLKLRDPELAAQAMQIHLDRVFNTIRRLMAEKRKYFSSTTSAQVDNIEATFTSLHPVASPTKALRKRRGP